MKKSLLFYIILMNCIFPLSGSLKTINRSFASDRQCLDFFTKNSNVNFIERRDVPLGDLRPEEIQQIQNEVNRSRIQIIIVGSAANSLRRNIDTDFPLAVFGGSKKYTKSDIDYVVKIGSEDAATLLSLPDMDRSWGVRGVNYINLDKGPIIVFNPNQVPVFITGAGRFEL